jgi:minimal PKS acyl carrier protein
MTNPFTLDDLARILLDCAGGDEDVDFDGDALDKRFEDLGYESLALLEAVGRIERELSTSLDDSLAESETPRALIDAVNAHLTTTT